EGVDVRRRRSSRHGCRPGIRAAPAGPWAGLRHPPGLPAAVAVLSRHWGTILIAWASWAPYAGTAPHGRKSRLAVSSVVPMELERRAAERRSRSLLASLTRPVILRRI